MKNPLAFGRATVHTLCDLDLVDSMSWPHGLPAEKVYEGFPLFLRRPAELDIDSLRPTFPILLIVTHEFSKRKPHGPS